MKVALQYWDARGQRAKRRFIAGQRSYHGNTLRALSLSGFLERRSPFEGSLVDVELVSAASDYRPIDGLRGAALTDALAQELDARIRAVGPEHVAAFVLSRSLGPRREPCLRLRVTQEPFALCVTNTTSF